MAVHLWVRAEERANEKRVGLTPAGAAALIEDGIAVTVEECDARAIETEAYRSAGARIVAGGAWRAAPEDAIIFGLKELPDDGAPLRHRHLFFGHAFKGQADAPALLARFRAGGGVLLDLEHLIDEDGRRLAAFGHWAGYAGAAVSVMAYAAQARGGMLGALDVFPSAAAMRAAAAGSLAGLGRAPRALVIGANGRVGGGARALLAEIGVAATLWDKDETATGGPFPVVLEHDIFLNAILAAPGSPVFVTADALAAPRALRAIGDIACDPGSPYSPIPIYDRVTTWAAPVIRTAAAPPLDVMAIDNLPSLLPEESSRDFAGQLLPLLRTLPSMDEDGVWLRARSAFDRAMS